MALVGRPNVGKSSLLNRLAKDERVGRRLGRRHHVDPVDSIVELGGEDWRFVDTAGLRRKVNTASGTEYYASLRTEAAIQAAEVAVVLLAADEVISEQDQRVITQVVDAGRALVIAFNKWDTLDEDRHVPAGARDRARPGPGQVGAPGSTSPPRPDAAWTSSPPTCARRWPRGSTRIPTAELNSCAGARPGDAAAGAGRPAPKIKYVTQADIRPPRFVRLLHRLPRGRLPAVPRAQAARAVGLRGHADRGLGQGARGPGEREAEGLTGRPRSRAAGRRLAHVLRPRRPGSSGSSCRCASVLGHHIHRPTSRFSAVTSTERTMIVSSSTPSATAMPSWVKNVSGRVASTANVPRAPGRPR